MSRNHSCATPVARCGCSSAITGSAAPPPRRTRTLVTNTCIEHHCWESGRIPDTPRRARCSFLWVLRAGLMLDAWPPVHRRVGVPLGTQRAATEPPPALLCVTDLRLLPSQRGPTHIWLFAHPLGPSLTTSTAVCPRSNAVHVTARARSLSPVPSSSLSQVPTPTPSVPASRFRGKLLQLTALG